MPAISNQTNNAHTQLLYKKLILILSGDVLFAVAVVIFRYLLPKEEMPLAPPSP